MSKCAGNLAPFTVNSAGLIGSGATVTVTTLQDGVDPVTGSFSVTYGSHSSMPIPYNARATDLASAFVDLVGLPNTVDIYRGGPDNNGGYNWTIRMPIASRVNQTLTVDGSMLQGNHSQIRVGISRNGTVPISGNFTLGFQLRPGTKETTHSIPYDASDALVRRRLMGLPGLFNISVSSSLIPPRSGSYYNGGKMWNITFASLALAGDQPALLLNSTFLHGSSLKAGVYEAMKGYSAPVYGLIIANMTGTFQLGFRDFNKIYNRTLYTRALPSSISSLALTAELETIPGLGGVAVERQRISGGYEWYIVMIDHLKDNTTLVLNRTRLHQMASTQHSITSMRIVANGSAQPLSGSFSLVYGQLCQSWQSGVHCDEAHSTPIHVNNMSTHAVKAALLALPPLVNISVSVNSIPLVNHSLNVAARGYQLRVTFHEVALNASGTAAVAMYPWTWVPPLAQKQWSGGLLTGGDIPLLHANATQLHGSGSTVDVWESRKGVISDGGGVVSVEVTQNGQDYSISGVTFEYSAATHVERLIPDHGPIYGNTEVLVIGKNFRNHSSLACRFGDGEDGYVYASLFINSSAVVCISPPMLKPGPLHVEVSNNGAKDTSSFSCSRVLFTYHPRIRIAGVFPSLGPASGNFSVRVVGGPFQETLQLRCRFGEVIVIGEYIDAEEMTCYAPPHQPGQYAMEISLNDHDYTDHRFPFRYYEDPALSRITPVSGPAVASGTPVTVYGNGFVNTTLLVCRFGGSVVPAVYKSSHEVLCYTPPLHPNSGGLSWTALSEQRSRHPDPFTGSNLLFPTAHFYPLYLCRLVGVEVSNNGQDFTDSGITYLYQADARVHSVSPSQGLDVGNTAIFVRGENFVNTTALRCRVGPYVTRGTFLSPEIILCFTPSSAVRQPSQGLLSDGLLFTPNYAHAPLSRVGPVGSPAGELFVEISLNEVDYTADRVVFNVLGPCPTGFFCPMGDLQTKLACPRGTYCPGEGNRNFTLCPRGTYQHLTAQSGCFRCPIGFACPEEGLHVPRICPAGKVSVCALVV